MSWFTWPFRLVGFLGWYALQIVLSNVAVLRDNLTPGQDSSPGVARYESNCQTNVEITLLAALITLTPGTLTMGMEVRGPEQERVLFVHGMYARDADDLRQSVSRLEAQLLSAIRRRGFSG